MSGEGSLLTEPRVVAQPAPAGPRSVVRPLAPQRYRVQFTIGPATHDKLRRLQALMRREIPSGDVAAIFDQAVDLMLGKVETAKLGTKAKVRSTGDGRRARAYEKRIRLKTDERGSPETGVSSTDATNAVSTAATSPPTRDAVSGVSRDAMSDVDKNAVKGESTDPVDGVGTDEMSAGSTDTVGVISTDAEKGASAGVVNRQTKTSRHVPNSVKRAVWWRDRAQCAFVSATGHRCMQRAFLEIHHIHPYALGGPPTVGNLSLRCRRHNAYEAEVVFGARRVATAQDAS